MSISRRRICCDGLASLSITSPVGPQGVELTVLRASGEHLDVVGHDGLQPRITYQKERAVLILKLFVSESVPRIRSQPKDPSAQSRIFFRRRVKANRPFKDLPANKLMQLSYNAAGPDFAFKGLRGSRWLIP